MSIFLPRFDLAPNARRTFRFHLAFALLDAAAGGILLNAPFVALRTIDAQNWQLPIREACVGIGMLASLYLGNRMAPCRKMPFVFVPGVFATLSALAMAAALAFGDPFLFLLMFGVGGMFEITTRPAVAAILRANYPVAVRGHVTATVRQWSSLSFMASIMLSAYILSVADDRAQAAAGGEIVCAALLGLAAFLCFRQIRVCEDVDGIPAVFRPEILKNLREAIRVVVRDDRYRRFLFGCFAEGFFGMLYFPLIAAFLSTTLGFGYFACAALMHGIPTLLAFAVTGLLGRWFDRANPWVSWAWVRFAFGLDALLLAATPLATIFFPPSIFILPVLGRVLRGSVQGGWWILWWQIGITHFARPGQDTSRYAGGVVFVNGAVRLAASGVGIGLTALTVQPVTLLWIGGLGVIGSGLYSLGQGVRERRQRRPATFAEFEAQFKNRT